MCLMKFVQMIRLGRTFVFVQFVKKWGSLLVRVAMLLNIATLNAKRKTFSLIRSFAKRYKPDLRNIQA